MSNRPVGLDSQAFFGADGLLFDGANTVLVGKRNGPAGAIRWPAVKCPHHRHVFADWRSRRNYPEFGEPAFLDRFDLTVGQSRDYSVWSADILGSPLTGARPHLMATLEPIKEAALAAGVDRHAVVAFVSNCRASNGRAAVLRDLIDAHGAVHSYGGCHHNRDVAQALGSDRPTGGASKYQEKLLVARQYRFAFVFENSYEPDYVTEKVWQAFEAGAIPVYRGPPDPLNVAALLPPNSYILAQDYPSPRLLSQHIKRVAADPELYQSYHEWRHNDTVREWLRTLAKRVRGYHECMVCEFLMSDRLQSEEDEDGLKENLDIVDVGETDPNEDDTRRTEL